MPLAPYRLRARNTATGSQNRIHDDTVARRYGYGGGLVPGVTIYAYLTHPVVEAWGAAWLERGAMEVAFVAPFYDGDETVVDARPAAPEDGGRAVELSAVNGEGRLCARARAVLPEARPAAPDPGGWPARPLPEAAERLPASGEALRTAEALGTLEASFRADEGTRYVEAVADGLAVYRGPEAVAHPGWLLSLANYALAANVALGPWIHTASRVQHLGTVADADHLSVRSLIADLSERRGHEMIDLDVLMMAGDRVVQRVRHSAIYRLRPPAADTAESSESR